jgi:hypothetical protein
MLMNTSTETYMYHPGGLQLQTEDTATIVDTSAVTHLCFVVF